MTLTAPEYWQMIHAERSRLAEFLKELDAQDWTAKTLSDEWTVEDVVAHLRAAANTGLVAWMGSMLRSGFKPPKHNQRQLVKYKGSSPKETLDIFRKSINNTIAPTKDYPAWLGEVIVHGQDIARALNLQLTPNPEAVAEVAAYYANKDFAVNSKSLISGLKLEATDSDFRAGEGPVVRGELLDLVMTMAGRPAYLADLEGDGVADLSRRMER